MSNENPDLKIAQAATLEPIDQIAKKLGLNNGEIEQYGKYKAKIPLSYIDEASVKKNKMILVTAITPTPAGEGKTTVSVGLSDGLNRIGKRAVAVLREPSLGPVFGIKGGATGGGYSQLIPMEDINLHFNGDFAAVEKANNLLSALINNNIYGRSRNLGIDPRTVKWRWAMDMNDRSLRHIITGLGGKQGGFLQESGFNITAASEIMAILCLAKDLADLKERMGNIYVGDTFSGEAIFAKDLNAHGAMAALLKDAIKPNLVQTLEGNPAIIHGGPFANIAQGTNSLVATKVGLSLAEYVVTEAGFGADLGAEKFFNIKCRAGEISPSAVVLVATVRALKYHGGVKKDNLKEPNANAVMDGLDNLEKHIENIKSFGVPVVVAINKFVADTQEEMQCIIDRCNELNVEIAYSDGWKNGGKGMEELAHKVTAAADSCNSDFIPTYQLKDSLKQKIESIAERIYGAKNVVYSANANSILKRADALGFSDFPVCVAKTQNSFSDDASSYGRPTNFTLNVREVEIAAGAGFIIPITGKMLRMPGLPVLPAAENIDIDENGNITGLF
ncbi:formate--tetrahydrofolate ligase [Ekhidna sp. To15]|uniref:formate--tetrahydrofolate ligase n=1 Tax=Ekhidna sp. To15 TaxID=3395267 RepID=UPI003F522D16